MRYTILYPLIPSTAVITLSAGVGLVFRPARTLILARDGVIFLDTRAAGGFGGLCGVLAVSIRLATGMSADANNLYLPLIAALLVVAIDLGVLVRAIERVSTVIRDPRSLAPAPSKPLERS